MDNYVLSSSFYCVVYNGQCIKANLPEGVDFENHTICFQNQKPVEIQFVYLLDQNESMDINIVIKEHVEVQMIETKSLKIILIFKRKYMCKRVLCFISLVRMTLLTKKIFM